MSSWTDEQTQFVNKCISAHGHNLLWNTGESITIKINSLSGLIPVTKKAKQFFSSAIEAKIYPFDQKVVFTGVKGMTQVVYASGDIHLHQKSDDSVKVFKNRRNHFKGMRKLLTWDMVDTFYFFGYALVTYYSIPSLLPKLEFLQEIFVKNLRGFKVRFPNDYNTHSEIQTFYFNEQGLLARHDYTADIISQMAIGSHFARNYISKSGVMIATERDVYMRLGSYVSSISVLSARIS